VPDIDVLVVEVVVSLMGAEEVVRSSVGAAAGSAEEAGEGSPIAPAPTTTDPAALVGAKARAAMALADSFDGVTIGSERDMFSTESSKGAGEVVRSSDVCGTRDVTN
jgi:hypothetical protein